MCSASARAWISSAHGFHRIIEYPYRMRCREKKKRANRLGQEIFILCKSVLRIRLFDSCARAWISSRPCDAEHITNFGYPNAINGGNWCRSCLSLSSGTDCVRSGPSIFAWSCPTPASVNRVKVIHVDASGKQTTTFL